jgi:predicted peptidase
MQQIQRFERTLIKTVQLNHWLHIPPTPSPTGKHPLILFLHGRGESGDDLNLVKVHGIPRIVDENPDFPFITVAPQCPMFMTWVLIADALEALVDDILQWDNVDTSRIYLTGLSMGGFGTWHLAVQRPEVFAAIAPVCGGGNLVNSLPHRICRLSQMPVWAFHGSADDVVPLSAQQLLIDALRDCSESEVKFTVYDGVDHDSWTQTYANPALYDWLLGYQR